MTRRPILAFSVVALLAIAGVFLYNQSTRVTVDFEGTGEANNQILVAKAPREWKDVTLNRPFPDYRWQKIAPKEPIKLTRGIYYFALTSRLDTKIGLIAVDKPETILLK